MVLDLARQNFMSSVQAKVLVLNGYTFSSANPLFSRKQQSILRGQWGNNDCRMIILPTI